MVPQTVVGGSVLQVMATDQDDGADGVLIYRITDVTNNGAAKFGINYTSGVITLIESLEEGLYSYNIAVLRVTDMGSPPRTATMNFAVNVPVLITSGVMWCDIDSRRLVKQVLKLLYGNFSRYR